MISISIFFSQKKYYPTQLCNSFLYELNLAFIAKGWKIFQTFSKMWAVFDYQGLINTTCQINFRLNRVQTFISQNEVTR